MATTSSPKTPASTSTLIDRAIARAGRTQKWVADEAGIALSTFRRKLAGHTDWYVGELYRIAVALNVHPSTFLPDEFRDDAAVETRQLVAA